MTGRPRVVVIDDHAGFRRLAAMLLRTEGYEVVGEAADGASGIALTAELAPQLVLLDVGLPDMDGFEVARKLALASDPAPVILISSRSCGEYGSLVRQAGVLGFIRKDELSGGALASLLATASA